MADTNATICTRCPHKPTFKDNRSLSAHNCRFHKEDVQKSKEKYVCGRCMVSFTARLRMTKHNCVPAPKKQEEELKVELQEATTCEIEIQTNLSCLGDWDTELSFTYFKNNSKQNQILYLPAALAPISEQDLSSQALQEPLIQQQASLVVPEQQEESKRAAESCKFTYTGRGLVEAGDPFHFYLNNTVAAKNQAIHNQLNGEIYTSVVMKRLQKNMWRRARPEEASLEEASLEEATLAVAEETSFAPVSEDSGRGLPEGVHGCQYGQVRNHHGLQPSRDARRVVRLCKGDGLPSRCHLKLPNRNFRFVGGRQGEQCNPMAILDIPRPNKSRIRGTMTGKRMRQLLVGCKWLQADENPRAPKALKSEPLLPGFPYLNYTSDMKEVNAFMKEAVMLKRNQDKCPALLPKEDLMALEKQRDDKVRVLQSVLGLARNMDEQEEKEEKADPTYKAPGRRKELQSNAYMEYCGPLLQQVRKLRVRALGKDGKERDEISENALLHLRCLLKKFRQKIHNLQRKSKKEELLQQRSCEIKERLDEIQEVMQTCLDNSKAAEQIYEEFQAEDFSWKLRFRRTRNSKPMASAVVAAFHGGEDGKLAHIRQQFLRAKQQCQQRQQEEIKERVRQLQEQWELEIEGAPEGGLWDALQKAQALTYGPKVSEARFETQCYCCFTANGPVLQMLCCRQRAVCSKCWARYCKMQQRDATVSRLKREIAGYKSQHDLKKKPVACLFCGQKVDPALQATNICDPANDIYPAINEVTLAVDEEEEEKRRQQTEAAQPVTARKERAAARQERKGAPISGDKRKSIYAAVEVKNALLDHAQPPKRVLPRKLF